MGYLQRKYEEFWFFEMYHEFPFSLGLSGHSLFNVYNKSISLCYWMINQESRQRVPLNFHLLLVQQQCSSATYTKVRSRIIELNLFYLTIYAGKWSGMLILNFSAYGLKIVSLHSFSVHMILYKSVVWLNLVYLLVIFFPLGYFFPFY